MMPGTEFLDKTLLAVSRVAEQSLLAEMFAREPGFLQKLDVRVKLVSFLLVLVLISLMHTTPALLFLALLAAVLAAASRVPTGFFLKRVWLIVPLFSAALALPAMLNVVTPGRPLLVLARFGPGVHLGPLALPPELTITEEGLRGTAVFIARVGASVSFAMLFTMTTKWTEVFFGLRALFIPRAFVITFSMTFRYLFVLLKLIQDMYRARKSRTIRPLAAGRDRSWTATRIGTTFKRSMDMSEDIYRAMLSRGFHGEFRSIRRSRIGTADIVWSVSVILAAALLLSFEKGFFSS